MKLRIIKYITILLVLSISLFLYPIGKLALTDTRITKSLFTDEYYVKINSNQLDFDVFREYMAAKGWKENMDKRLGALHIFEKDGKEKRILDTVVKTIFIDGKLNL